MARMQETLNALNERLESIDRREMKHHHKKGEGAEGKEEEVDTADELLEDDGGSKSFL